jgi:hypothetical protein
MTEQSTQSSQTSHGDQSAVAGPYGTANVNIYNTIQQAPLTPGAAPPLPNLIVGREDDMAALEQRLAGETETTLLTAVRGWPGIGKTTLAAALAHDKKLKEAFPDGVLWIALGQDPGVHLGLGDWLTALGEDPRAYPTPEARTQRLAAMLRQKKMLLIVDDVWEATDAQPFLVGGAGCRTLITTREPKVARDLGLPDQAIYRLLVLSEEASLELLSQIAPSVVESDPEGVKTLVNELEGLPLALHVAGRLLVEEAELGLGVSELLAELAEGVRILEEKAPGDRTELATQTTPTVAALFKRSTDRLDEEAHERFALLGIFVPKPATFDAPAIAAAWGVDDPKPTLRTLLARGLIEPAAGGRFQMHALLAVHAKSLWGVEGEATG